eukprot:TRINITY_DN32733_c0_g1_i1.p1 TRINITY_DN32733_c0_g1~~TRINITY_DN32733_c0_g1_i1.p1  ORF type:complete len:309 (+),score=24.98 TRINITY_DN32733_c0_g1_i1:80-1006(+)
MAVACSAKLEANTVRDAGLIDLRMQAPSVVPTVTSSCLRRRRRYRLAFYRGACCVVGGPPGLQHTIPTCVDSLSEVTASEVRATRLAAIEQAMHENAVLSLEALRQIGERAAVSVRAGKRSDAPFTATQPGISRETQTEMWPSAFCTSASQDDPVPPENESSRASCDFSTSGSMSESSIVVLTGLVADRLLNGKLGVVMDTSLASGRFKVMLLGRTDGRVVAVPPHKLVPFMSTVSSLSACSRIGRQQYRSLVLRALQHQDACVQLEGIALARVMADCDWRRQFDKRGKECASSDLSDVDSQSSDFCL